MAWRLANSLKRLQAELTARYPDRTLPDWEIGDADHQARASDHNPNAADVVCAIDVREGGIDLAAVAEHLKRTNHRAVKYVIFNRRIWSKARNAEGWRAYGGSNPHTSHMHISVGVGADGHSTGPYDDTSSWGIASASSGSTGGDDEMFVREGDEGDAVEYWQRMLNALGYEAGDTDGIYGPKTEAAVQKIRREFGQPDYTGVRVTPWTALVIHRELAKKYAGKDGERGPAGKDGKPGQDGRTPTKVAIRGDVIEVD